MPPWCADSFLLRVYRSSQILELGACKDPGAWIEAMSLLKVISGGQTGVDRGALDAALAAHFPCGGWCPADRKAEDGEVPEEYPVTPLRHGGYRARTRKNVEESDGKSWGSA
jgi:hypothetical protein